VSDLISPKKVVEIVEVGPRDGLQNEAMIIPVSAKLRYITALVDSGLKRIEAVSFVDPRRVPQMAGAEELMAMVPRESGLSYSALILNQRGLDRALACGVDEVNFVILATETFSQKNQGMSIDASMKELAGVAARVKQNGIKLAVTVGAAFGCPYEGELAPETIVELVSRILHFGPDEIALADTIGVAVPHLVEELILGCRTVSGQPLRFHFHNTRNTGYANALRALELGVNALDATTGGIGGCPFAGGSSGNLATEDLNYLMTRSGYDSTLDFDRLLIAQAYIADQLERDVPGLLAKAGWFPVSNRSGEVGK
jgi:hydroxymethylglutaryl-CoA lyase